jgi:hypothetical protein
MVSSALRTGASLLGADTSVFADAGVLEVGAGAPEPEVPQAANVKARHALISKHKTFFIFFIKKTS